MGNHFFFYHNILGFSALGLSEADMVGCKCPSELLWSVMSIICEFSRIYTKDHNDSGFEGSHKDVEYLHCGLEQL